MTDYIKPRVLKGFRDSLPEAEIKRQNLCETLEQRFRSYGFVPIDTPAMEYADILLGKGGGETEKQIYRFTDQGGRDVALRFDLTVPFARFMAEHRSKLYLPFKRYHIAKVWRGENTQRGRYREFFQCDFDIVGTDSVTADFEILLLMHDCLRSIGLEKFTIRLNHRAVFNRVLDRLGLGQMTYEILRTVDKLTKIGHDETFKVLSQIAGTNKAASIMTFITKHPSFEETLAAMTEAAGGSGPDTERLASLWQFMIDADVTDRFVLDPSITRGLDYYTGVVFESFLDELPSIGSVCSGGRYDDLATLYSPERLPGIGSSIGIDRLITAIDSLGQVVNGCCSAVAAVACLDETLGGLYQVLAGQFRQAGIACEVFNDAKKIASQYVLAEQKGLSWVICVDANDQDFKNLRLRQIATRQDQPNLDLDQAIATIKRSKAG